MPGCLALRNPSKKCQGPSLGTAKVCLFVVDATHLYVGEVGAVLVQHDVHEAPDLPGYEVPVDHPVLVRVSPAELRRLAVSGKNTKTSASYM